MEKLSDLPNIGEELEKQLNEIGIYTYDDLVNGGSTGTWMKIKEKDPSACINRLMALEGAIQKIKWHNLSNEDKRYLSQFYNEMKSID